MTIYGRDPKKKVRGPSDKIFILVLVLLGVIFCAAVIVIGKEFYPLFFER